MLLESYAARAQGVGRFARAVLARFASERGPSLAASLTYTTLLALVPLLAIALALVTAFPAFDTFAEATRRYLEENLLPPRVGDAVLGYLREFSAGAARLTLVGLAVLAVSALLMMHTIESAFNAIWRVRRRRPLALRVLVYAVVVTLGPLLVGASLTMTSYLLSASLGFAEQVPGGGEVLLIVAQWAMTSTAFTLLYFIVPNRAVRLRHAVAGGVAAALLFEATSRAFAAYLGYVSTYTLVYGAFSVVPLFLVWVYLSWVVTLAGAVLTAMLPDYAHATAGRAPKSAPALGDVLQVLRVLVMARQRGYAPTSIDVAAHAGLALERCEATLYVLAERGWLARTDAGRWRLACEPDQVTAAAVYDSVCNVVVGGKNAPTVVDGLLERSAAATRAALAVPLAALADPPTGDASTRP